MTKVSPWILDLSHVSPRCKDLLAKRIREVVQAQRIYLLESIESYSPGPARDDMQRWADACRKVDDDCNMFRRAVEEDRQCRTSPTDLDPNRASITTVYATAAQRAEAFVLTL